MATENLTILYDVGGVLAVNKPSGFETIAANGEKCVTRMLRAQCLQDSIEPAHRLDRDTTGVQIFARNSNILKKLIELFKHRRTSKFYLAICAGIPANREGTIRRNLSQWTGGHRPVQVVKGNGGLTATTEYQVLAFNNDFPASLILFHPREGRTHQIRVHAGALGRPILGDDQYGDRDANRKVKEMTGLKRQALHAWRIILPDLCGDDSLVEISAPVPMDMQRTLDAFFPAWREVVNLREK